MQSAVTPSKAQAQDQAKTKAITQTQHNSGVQETTHSITIRSIRME